MYDFAMRRVHLDHYGYDFVPSAFLREGEDEYWSRNQQIASWNVQWRKLDAVEREQLVSLGNTSTNWDHVLVEDPIDLSLIRNNAFYGLVRIGSMQPYTVGFHDFILPEGVRNSHIISCDIGRHSSIHRVGFLSHYIISERSILSEIDEMGTTNHSKFGNGTIKEGEEESVRVWMALVNENEGRKVLPFEKMKVGDAWIWSTYREREALLEKFVELTNKEVTKRLGVYGEVGSCSVIKSCRIIKDVQFGESVYVKGANKLKNLTIRSHKDSPSQIGEGVELVNGIIGYGCRVFYGVKAVRFVMGDNSNLKYGARLLNSYLGDNSTVSCCEVLNTLAFPFHEQHHNNSFLIASLIEGQSNMAAGANIGSNHNTRSNDGEMRAKRGFWPALSSSIKFSSNFASHTLIAKGSYPHELNIPLPFSMISYCEEKERLKVIPAFWWMYNRFALERNEKKYLSRDKRVFIGQRIEINYLAPDTILEILEALKLLETWVGEAVVQASLVKQGKKSFAQIGELFLEERGTELSSLEIYATTLERSQTPSIILKAEEGYRAYKEMLLYGAMKIVLLELEERELSISSFIENYNNDGQLWDLSSTQLHNMGGQIVAEHELLALLEEIEGGKLRSWDEIHLRYELWWSRYPKQKSAIAYQTLLKLLKAERLEEIHWEYLIDRFIVLSKQMAAEVLKNRVKDSQEPFRKSVYHSVAQMEAVIGRAEENSFVIESQKESLYLRTLARRFSPWT